MQYQEAGTDEDYGEEEVPVEEEEEA